MKLVVTSKNKERLNRLLEFTLYFVTYTIVFIIVTNLFDTVYIDTKHSYIYSCLIVLILSILNSTVKPVLVTLTMPLTGITFGIFYPCINLFLLKLVDWILGSHFELENILVAFFVAILLSVINFIVENLLVKPIIERVKKYGKSST